MKNYNLLISLLLLFFLTNCATSSVVATGSNVDLANEALEQTGLALSTRRDRNNKINDLYWPIRVSNTDLCHEDTAYVAGFSHTRISEFDREHRQAAALKLGVAENPTVFSITENGPAQAAGLAIGDIVTSFNSEPIGTSNRDNRRLRNYLSNMTEDPITLGILRSGKSKLLTIQPQLACSYQIVLDPSDALNAYADGNTIYITTGMYRFVESDQELQLVIAHELAHNSEGHINSKIGNSLIGAVLDITAAAYGVNTQGAFSETAGQMFSQDFEREADYVALYMLAKAHIPIDESANFWRRMAAEYPASISGSFTGSHPSSAERYVNIDATIAEIKQKQEAGILLLPERKE